MDGAREVSVMRATIHSVCECQGKLGADLDEQKQVIRGWVTDRRSGRQLVAPAHSIGAERSRFDVAWQCPLCTRNQLRSFDAGGLSYRDDGGRAA